MMMTLSLAIDVGDYPFAIDTVLKVNVELLVSPCSLYK